MITEKTFSFPAELKGISSETMAEHLKLYTGYVKHANLALAHNEELSKDAEKYAYELGELSRRFSFEYNGIKNHEYYFEQLEHGPTTITAGGILESKIKKQWGSFDHWLAAFKILAKTRGIGWAVLYFDAERDLLMNVWVDEQHLGHLNSCQFIFGIDMWEHSYVKDYLPSGKVSYIEDYLAQVNWNVVEKRIM